jgi:AcrR family transcriptional regulator
MEIDLKHKVADLRRQHLLDAAIRVFDTHGFHGATIKDIAREAGVADGTVYNVFANKEALLLGILEPLLRASQPQPASGSAPARSPAQPGEVASLLTGMIAGRWQALTPQTLAMMRIIWSEALTNRDLAKQYLETIIAPTLEGPVPLFEELSDRGAIAATDIPMTLRVIIASFLGLALLGLLGDPVLKDRPGEVPQALAALLLNGLLPRQTQGNHHDAA